MLHSWNASSYFRRKMNLTMAASKRSNLLRLLLKPQISANHLSLLRHLSSEPTHPPQKSSPPPTDDSSVITQVVTLLQTNDNDWDNSYELQQLLFPSTGSPHSLSPLSLLKITRRLGTTAKALKFFEYISANSPSPPYLSLTFQGVFEIASREQSNSPNKLYELLTTLKHHRIPLTVDSATLLVRCFGRAGMVDKSLFVYKELDPYLQNTHVRNALLDVLLRCGRVDEALQVLDEMLKPDGEFPPNENTMNIVFGALLRRDQSGRRVSEEEIAGLSLKFGEHGLFPSALWLTQLITKLCRSGKSDRAWELLHDSMKLGGELEAASCNALLTGLGRERNFQRMNMLLKEMKEKGIQPNVITFGILINHLCKFRRVDEALEVFEKMRGGGESDGVSTVSVEPDVILYNTLIDGLCKVGRQEEGLGLMKRMRSNQVCAPNTVTFNCLIDGFCKAGEIERSRELFDQMKKEGVLPNVITLNTLVDGMCKNGRINSAMEFFNEMQEKGLKGNGITYTALIDAFCKVNNISKATELFDEMLKSGCYPDATVYYTLISGLTLAGRLDDASTVASAMKKAGFCLDVVCYNVLIGGFCRKNRLDRAYEMLKEMEQAGLKPDGVTYNTLISYFSNGGDFATAHRVMRKMINDGLVPTVVTYGSLIHAYCSVGNLDESMKIFRDMSSSSRVPPNTVIYNILIDSLCKNDKVDVALSLMGDMKDKGVRPTTTTYNAMFKGLQDKNWLERALELMDQMNEQACNPDYITMEILTTWLSAVGEKEKLRKFVQGYEVFASTA